MNTGAGGWQDYIDYVRNTRPVLFVPVQGTRAPLEVVRTVAATPTGVLTGRSGPFPGASSGSWPGTNDNLSIATNATYHPGDTFSVAGWFNRLSTGSNTEPNIISSTGSNGEFRVGIVVATNALRLFLTGTGAIYSTAATFPAVSTNGGKWHHFAMAKAGASFQCLIDGKVDSGTFTNQTVAGNASNWTMGMFADSTNDYAGLMANVAIWNRALTYGEMLGLWLAGVEST